MRNVRHAVLIGIVVACGVLGDARPGLTDPLDRRPLDQQWNALMLSGAHAGYKNGVLRKAAGHGIAPPTGTGASAPEWSLALSPRGIYVSDMTEKRLGGLWRAGGWTLLGGLLKGIDIGGTVVELYGKRIDRRDPIFVLSAPFRIHDDLDDLVAYEFYLLRRRPGQQDAEIVKQWTIPREAVDLPEADDLPDVHGYLEYESATKTAKVRITGLKAPIDESIPLP